MNRDRRNVLRAWVLVLQLGLVNISAIAICLLIGWALKTYAGVDVMVGMVIFGIICGFVASFRMAYHEVGGDDEETRQRLGIYDRKTPEEEPLPDEREQLQAEWEELQKKKDQW